MKIYWIDAPSEKDTMEFFFGRALQLAKRNPKKNVYVISLSEKYQERSSAITDYPENLFLFCPQGICSVGYILEMMDETDLNCIFIEKLGLLDGKAARVRLEKKMNETGVGIYTI